MLLTAILLLFRISMISLPSLSFSSSPPSSPSLSFQFTDFRTTTPSWLSLFSIELDNSHGDTGSAASTEAHCVTVDPSTGFLHLSWSPISCPSLCHDFPFAAGDIRTAESPYSYGWFGVVASPPFHSNGSFVGDIVIKMRIDYEFGGEDGYVATYWDSTDPTEVQCMHKSDSHAGGGGATEYYHVDLPDPYRTFAAAGTHPRIGTTVDEGMIELGWLMKKGSVGRPDDVCAEFWVSDLAGDDGSPESSRRLLEVCRERDDESVPLAHTGGELHLYLTSNDGDLVNTWPDGEVAYSVVRMIRFVEGNFDGVPPLEDDETNPQTALIIGIAAGGAAAGIVVCLLAIALLVLISVAIVRCCRKRAEAGIIADKDGLDGKGELSRSSFRDAETKMAEENVARFKINRALFKIPMDSVTLVKLLGQGGSESMVYEW